MTSPADIARREAEYLSALNATVTVRGATIILDSGRKKLTIECVNADRFVVEGREANRRQLFARARIWASS